MADSSTHQGSPKVPKRTWPPVKLGHRELMRLTTWDAYPAAVEEETYIPVSALLSDEVVEAVARSFFEFVQKDRGLDGNCWPPRISEVRDGWMSRARQFLQIAIEQVGGAGE